MSYDIKQAVENNNELFRVLVENCPTAFIISRQTDVIYANPACLQMLGYDDLTELQGVSLLKHVAPQCRDELAEKLSAHLNNSIVPLKYQTMGLRNNGSIFSLELQIVNLYLNDGLSTIAYITDFTEQKKSQDALEKSEKKYRELVNEATSIILRWNINGEVTFFNEYAQNFFGYSAEEIIGKNVVGTIVPEQEFTGRDLQDLMEQIKSDPALFEYNENENIKKNGDRVWITWKNKSVFNKNGKLVEILSVGIDSSKRKIAEEKIKKSEEEFKSILYSLQDTYYKADVNGIISLVSPSVRELLGYEKHEIEGTPLTNLYVESKDRDKFLKKLSDNNGAISNYPLQLFRKNGSTIWVSATAHFCYDLMGSVTGVEGIARNITQLMHIEKSLRASEERFKAIFNANADAVLYVDVNRTVVMINPAVSRLFGYSIDELKNRSSEILYDNLADFSNLGHSHFNLNAATDQGLYEILYRRKNGSSFIGETFGTKILDEQGVVIGFMAIMRDVSEKKRIEEKLRLSQKIFEEAGKAILVSDSTFNIVDVNDAFCEITGFNKQDLIGKKPQAGLSDRYSDEFFHEIYKSLLSTGYWQGELWQKKKNGEVYPNWATISVVKDESGNLNHYVSVYSDITEIKKTEERLEQLAHYDQLTGLPNRMLFNDRLHAAIARAQRHNESIAIMYIDLDGFKQVNDTLGHSEGDSLLRKISAQLKNCIREEDTVARLGGDEFAIIVSELQNSHYLHVLAKRLIDELYITLTFEGRELHVSGSIGIAIFPDKSTNESNLLRHADQAMYQAKQSGKNTYQFFDQAMNLRIMSRIRLESDLRLAIKADEIYIHYQPKLSLLKNKIVGVEVLARWNHDIRGNISPQEFVALAEDSELIIELGKQVLEQACRNMRLWMNAGNKNVSVAVNISAKQFKDENFVDIVRIALSKAQFPPNLLELELTESLLMDDIETTIEKLEQLKELGIHISIDDFGTGYSSLNYLKKLPVDTLKIDQSFIKDIATDSDDRAIISAIISMANSLNLKVIAEGVENQQQLNYLTEKKCDEVQGFLLAKPVRFEELESTIQSIEENDFTTT